MAFDVGPAHDCPDCPRLAAFRTTNRAAYPEWWNAPVPSFGKADARVLIVGLAPGLRGANRTGRPFTGDYAGELLYSTLIAFGFASGAYDRRPDDGLDPHRLRDRQLRALRSAAKQADARRNRDLPPISRHPRSQALPRLKVMLALGRIAHESAVRALKLPLSKFPFAHGARHTVTPAISLFDSYHCSRYNTNTGVLTEAMFARVFASVRAELDAMDAAAPAAG